MCGGREWNWGPCMSTSQIVRVFLNFVGGAPSNQLLATQSKIIYEILGRKQEYMSLVYVDNSKIIVLINYAEKSLESGIVK